jgi:hypothetical protein
MDIEKGCLFEIEVASFWRYGKNIEVGIHANACRQLDRIWWFLYTILEQIFKY